MSNQLEWQHLHKRAFRAMGCQMTVWLELEHSHTASTLLAAAEGMFRDAERRLSRFDPSSELSQVNSRPGKWTRTSETLWTVLTQALSMARETGGLFDPTQLTALEAAGYTCSFEQLPAVVGGLPDVETAANRLNQWQTIQLDGDKQSIWLPPGVKLDLGGIAKGYTAQQAVRYLSDWGPGLVDAGGDLTAGEAPWGWPGWPVAISAPFSFIKEQATELVPLWLVQGTMATSGVDYRRWQHNGRAAHHVIDPRTSLPAETDLLTVTVLAREAVRAEAWSTASLAAGSADAQQRLTRNNLAAALVDQLGNLHLTPALASFLDVNVQQAHM